MRQVVFIVTATHLFLTELSGRRNLADLHLLFPGLIEIEGEFIHILTLYRIFTFVPLKTRLLILGQIIVKLNFTYLRHSNEKGLPHIPRSYILHVSLWGKPKRVLLLW
jgi:hypothetical protein